MESRIELEILNHSEEILDSVVVIGPETVVKLGVINREREVKTYFYPQGQGTLKIQISSDDKKAQAIISDYITRLPGRLEDSKIIINPNLEITVINLIPAMD